MHGLLKRGLKTPTHHEAVAGVCSCTDSERRNASLPTTCKAAAPSLQMHPCLKYNSNPRGCGKKKDVEINSPAKTTSRECLKVGNDPGSPSNQAHQKQDAEETWLPLHLICLGSAGTDRGSAQSHEEKTYAAKGRTSFILPACVRTRSVL